MDLPRYGVSAERVPPHDVDCDAAIIGAGHNAACEALKDLA